MQSRPAVHAPALAQAKASRHSSGNAEVVRLLPHPMPAAS
jgi:hypothetical protein